MEALKTLLTHIVSELIDENAIESITVNQEGYKLSFQVITQADFTGKLIGKNGATASAIRQLMQAVGSKDKYQVDVHFA